MHMDIHATSNQQAVSSNHPAIAPHTHSQLTQSVPTPTTLGGWLIM